MAIYFDNSATTKVDKRVLDSMIPFFEDRYGNPSSVHSLGREARSYLDSSRKVIADILKAEESEIIFTGSGTESNNIAICQAALALAHKGKHIITSAVEHKAVLEPCHFLEKEGFEVTYLPVDKNGLINIDDVKKAIRKDTIFITIMLANNEIGTIQPIKEIAKLAHDNSIFIHTDAVQAMGKMPVDVSDLGVDMLTVSGHKIYAPKGVGILYIDKEFQSKLTPFTYGGDQEFGLRPGTENIPYIVGIAKAFEILDESLDKNIEHLKAVRDRFEKKVAEEISDTYVNCATAPRVPSISSTTFRFIEGEALMVYAREVCCSAGSACTSTSSTPSHVLGAIGMDEVDFHGTLRFSFGINNTFEEVDEAVEILKTSVNKLRAMSPLVNSK